LSNAHGSTAAQDPLLASLVAEDRKIERRQDSAILALMEHRWKAVHEHGFSMRAYSRALGHSSPTTVRKYVCGWEIWLDAEELHRGEAAQRYAELPGEFTPHDALVLANMSEEQAEAAKIVAEAEGIGVAQVAKSDKHRPKIRAVRKGLADMDEDEEEEPRRPSWRDGQPRVRDMMDEGDPFNPGEYWADTIIISLGKRSRELEGRVRAAGGVILGTLTAEKALKYLEDTERRVAEVRAAVQEILTERKL
jgi:hypothetical protein